jgi:hypothetical protein
VTSAFVFITGESLNSIMAHPHFKGNLKKAISEHLNLENHDFAVSWEMTCHETIKQLHLSGLNSMPVPLSLKVRFVIRLICELLVHLFMLCAFF